MTITYYFVDREVFVAYMEAQDKWSTVMDTVQTLLDEAYDQNRQFYNAKPHFDMNMKSFEDVDGVVKIGRSAHGNSFAWYILRKKVAEAVEEGKIIVTSYPHAEVPDEEFVEISK